MSTLSKAVMAEHLVNRLNISKPQAYELIEAFFEAIKAALENGHPVKCSGFGNFSLRDKLERPGRNPKTGEVIPVTARRVVTFRAGHKFKKQIDAQKE